jgi:hypothetical protein
MLWFYICTVTIPRPPLGSLTGLLCPVLHPLRLSLLRIDSTEVLSSLDSLNVCWRAIALRAFGGSTVRQTEEKLSACQIYSSRDTRKSDLHGLAGLPKVFTVSLLELSAY